MHSPVAVTWPEWASPILLRRGIPGATEQLVESLRPMPQQASHEPTRYRSSIEFKLAG